MEDMVSRKFREVTRGGISTEEAAEFLDVHCPGWRDMGTDELADLLLALLGGDNNQPV